MKKLLLLVSIIAIGTSSLSYATDGETGATKTEKRNRPSRAKGDTARFQKMDKLKFDSLVNAGVIDTTKHKPGKGRGHKGMRRDSARGSK